MKSIKGFLFELEADPQAETDPDGYTGVPKVNRKNGRVLCKNGKEPDEDGKCFDDKDMHDDKKESTMSLINSDELFLEEGPAKEPKKTSTAKPVAKVGKSVVFDREGKQAGEYNSTPSGFYAAASHASKIGGKAKYQEACGKIRDFNSSEMLEAFTIGKEEFLKEQKNTKMPRLIEHIDNKVTNGFEKPENAALMLETGLLFNNTLLSQVNAPVAEPKIYKKVEKDNGQALKLYNSLKIPVYKAKDKNLNERKSNTLEYEGILLNNKVIW